MGGYRHERVAELIHRELSQRLRGEIKDAHLEPVSITHVSVSRDLRRAWVQYCPLGGGSPSAELISAVESAAKNLRGPIGRALRLRHSPELIFQVDTHTDQAMHVNRLIEEAARERQARAGEGAEDTVPQDAASSQDADVQDPE